MHAVKALPVHHASNGFRLGATARPGKRLTRVCRGAADLRERLLVAREPGGPDTRSQEISAAAMGYGGDEHDVECHAR